MKDPSQPTEMMLDEILERYKRSFTGIPGIYKTKAETIAAIQTLVEKAIPERKNNLLEDSLGNKYRPLVQIGFNEAIDDLRSRFMRAGLLGKEKI